MRSQLTILHLDDDALFLEQFAATVQAAKLDLAIRVESVDNVDDYFARLASLAPDVAVLDINVGGALLGEDVARRTKAAHPTTLVFMCSDMKGIGLVGACLSAGADDFIFKGSDEHELALRIYGTWKLRAGDRAAPPKLAGAVGPTMEAVATRAARLVGSAVTAVHVRGESGTGKELVSDLLAAALPKGTPFVRVNCGAIAPTLLESELFGHVRGAFTGATHDKAGLIESADGGWIFFDEVATLSQPAQVALLRTLENRTLRRVGGAGERKVNIRVLSATNEPMEKMIAAGRFRADLWQRLCEASIELPPLRERMGEFEGLVRHFCRTMANGPYEISESALEILSAYDWHEGNVRELRNCLRAMTEMAVGRMLTPISVPKWFWEKAEQKPDEQPATAGKPATAGGGDEIRLAWRPDGTTSFDLLTSRLLLEIVRREAHTHGKISIRHLARVTAIPKSTLSSKLKHLVDQNLITLGDMSKLVNVGRE